MAHRLAWAYVILRVLHSLVQVTGNKVMLRFGLFSISTIVLIVMACRAFADIFFNMGNPDARRAFEINAAAALFEMTRASGIAFDNDVLACARRVRRN